MKRENLNDFCERRIKEIEAEQKRKADEDSRKIIGWVGTVGGIVGSGLLIAAIILEIVKYF